MTPRRLSRDGSEEARLVARCRQGEVEAFATLIERYQDGVYRVIYRMVGDREEARDLAQEAFIRAFEGLGTFNVRKPFRPWMWRIAANVAIDYLRRQDHPNDVPLEAVFDVDADREPQVSESDGPESAALSREVSDIVWRELLRLQVNWRAAIVLHHMEGISYSDIGDILGVPRNTAKTWAHRAKGELCRSLEGVI
jgi:RNA polymerase sigma-70 factor (ECF subfamily)